MEEQNREEVMEDENKTQLFYELELKWLFKVMPDNVLVQLHKFMSDVIEMKPNFSDELYPLDVGRIGMMQAMVEEEQIRRAKKERREENGTGNVRVHHDDNTKV